ncbi:MAG: zinc ribbon domain-containing protein [Candidatus Bathyarchaeia archaeon]
MNMRWMILGAIILLAVLGLISNSSIASAATVHQMDVSTTAVSPLASALSIAPLMGTHTVPQPPETSTSSMPEPSTVAGTTTVVVTSLRTASSDDWWQTCNSYYGNQWNCYQYTCYYNNCNGNCYYNNCYNNNCYTNYYNCYPTCNPSYPNYPYNCNPNYGYPNQYQTATTTATMYSAFTETSFITSTETPQAVTAISTFTSITTTTDTTLVTALGALTGILVGLFLAAIFLLMRRGTSSHNQPSNSLQENRVAPTDATPSQATSVGNTSKQSGLFCMSCGTRLPQGAKFCGECGGRQPKPARSRQ